jgi:hypothetical protein
MVAYWKENARPLSAFFDETPLRKISPSMIAAYQNARTDAGRAPKTVNGEVAVLRQVTTPREAVVSLRGRVLRSEEHEAAGRSGPRRRGAGETLH